MPSYVDIAMRICGVSLPEDYLESFRDLAQQALILTSCSDNEDVIRLMEYIYALSLNPDTQPCIMKLNELLLQACPDYEEDLAF